MPRACNCLPAWLLSLVPLAVAVDLLAAPPIKRARPPKFPQAVKDAFFVDARTRLEGPRPESVRSGDAPATAVLPTPSNSGSGGFAWSKLIDAETLEDEVKASQRALSEAITIPEKFKGGGYKVGREEFTVAAAMFGIIAQYDGQVRWKQPAAALRDALAQAGANCKTASDQSFNESRLRKDDLERLVRGDTVSLRPRAEDPTWEKVAHRPPLMKRLERAHEKGLVVWTGSSTEFGRHQDKLRHEAQVLSAIAEIIQRDHYEFADDDTYLEYARAMRDGAAAVAEAARNKNYEQARKAVGQISKSCSNCHEGYRN